MIKFKINDFITVKLENDETVIYVKDEKFLICKHLVLNIPINEITSLDEIQSIDEIPDRQIQKQEIPPKVEFWGHCSNLQVWYENNYNTRLLHSNLAFPLLKRLVEVGDPQAKKAFKEEIAVRFSSAHYPIVKYLFKEGYLEILNNLELKSLIQDCFKTNTIPKKLKILLQRIIMREIEQQFPHIDEFRYFVEDDKIVDLKISRKSERKVKNTRDIFCLLYLTDLKILSLANFEESSLCEFENLENLEKLVLLACNVKEIKCLHNLCRLKVLELNDNKIRKIEGLKNLKNLDKLYLINNLIEEIDYLEGLENLSELNLTDNKIKDLKGINRLVNLRKLWLYHNEISDITGIRTLKNIKYLDLARNQIVDISPLKQLKDLEILKLSKNKINDINVLQHLPSLEKIDIKNNLIPDYKDRLVLEKIKKKNNLSK